MQPMPPTHVGPNITLTNQTVCRCIHCGLPITFVAVEIPFYLTRTEHQPRQRVGSMWAHPTAADCAAESARRVPATPLAPIIAAMVRRNDALFAQLQEAPHANH